MPLDRPEIAARLREIGAYLRVLAAEPYRARAYEQGAAAVEALGDAFDRLADEGRLTEVPGIGPSLAAAIDELRRTGTHRKLESLRADLSPGLVELAALPGLTPTRLRALQDQLGVTGALELRDALAAGRLRALKGFGEKAEAKLREALERHLAGRDAPVALLVEAQELGAALLARVRESSEVVAAELGGALRRAEETVSEMVLVVATPDPSSVLDRVAGWPHVASLVERQGLSVASARLSNGLPLLVVALPPAGWAAALVRATGSAAHVAALDRRAAARGTTLEAIAAPDEAGLYRALGLPFVPPELREDAGELEQAEAGDDFADLVTLADLRGAVHCHTSWSDGRNTLEEMARAAESRGLEYMTITDHSPTASYAGGLDRDRLHAQAEEIARVQRLVGVRLLRGTESDILADGSLDFADEELAQLDVVIASVHNRYRQDRAEATARLVRAMRLPTFKIWGHALGRLLLRRDPIDCDVEAVLDAAAEGRAAIEINGDPNRLDLPRRWAREARRRGLPFVISADAHATGDLDYLQHGVLMARRAGVRRGEVLNVRDVEGFAAAVRP